MVNSAGTNIVVLFPLAMTMVILTVVSLFIFFTLTPLLCSIILEQKKTGTHTLFSRMESIWNRSFDHVVQGYRSILPYNEKHRWSAMLFIVFALLALVHAFIHIPKLGTTMTLAAVLGIMPLGFGQGIGAEMRNACGLASMGGIFVSGVLILFVMPAVYNLFTRRNSSKIEGYQKTEKSGK
jgi:multidrug efflux pump subunit AcrB